MRDYKHYKKMFEGADTIGVELLAKALHTTRTRVDERPPAELVRALRKLHGASVERQAALTILADEAGSAEKDERASEDLGARLEQERRALKLSRPDLAAITGMSPETIKGVENGGNPTLSTLRALAGALDLDLAELVGGSDE